MVIEAGVKTEARTGNMEAQLCVTILPSNATKAFSLTLLVGLSSVPWSSENRPNPSSA